MSSIDEQFVDYIVKSLVGNPDAVSIHRSVDEKGVLLELTVDPEDLGRIIGKRGATAQSLRTLLRALGTKNDARYNLKIIDNGPQDGRHDGPPPAEDRPARDEAPTTDTPDEPVADTPAPAAVADDDDDSEAPEADTSESDHSDAISKTRKELEDLDDLDI